MLINGRCHCGNIRIRLDWPGNPKEIPARACSCSFCTRHGGVWTSNPAAALDLEIADPKAVSRYAFGTGTAEFLVCQDCGVVPVATSTIDYRVHAVVNVNCFEGVDPAMFVRAASNFDGEEEAERRARRQRNWIGTVRGSN